MAVIQDNIKRLLAYSSIAHAGYLLDRLRHRHGRAATPPCVFYLIAYVFMNLGAFARGGGARAEAARTASDIEAFAGLAQRAAGPRCADDAVHALARRHSRHGGLHRRSSRSSRPRSNAGDVWLTIIGVLTSVVSVYYYLRVPVLMYMREPGDEAAARARARQRRDRSCSRVCAVAVRVPRVLPELGALPIFGDVHVLDWARESVSQLFSSGLS